MEMTVFLYACIIGHNSVVSDFFQNIDFIGEELHLLEFRRSKFFQDKWILRESEEKANFN